MIAFAKLRSGSPSQVHLPTQIQPKDIQSTTVLADERHVRGTLLSPAKSRAGKIDKSCFAKDPGNRVLILLNMRSYMVAESLRGLAKKPPDNDVRLDIQKTQYGALYSYSPRP
jgi:hypothetical protein